VHGHKSTATVMHMKSYCALEVTTRGSLGRELMRHRWSETAGVSV